MSSDGTEPKGLEGNAAFDGMINVQRLASQSCGGEINPWRQQRGSSFNDVGTSTDNFTDQDVSFKTNSKDCSVQVGGKKIFKYNTVLFVILLTGEAKLIR